jgi:hypothetical protein
MSFLTPNRRDYPTITFYIPKALWPQTMPASADENWSGFGLGLYAWTVQTYLRLRTVGVPCELTSTVPDTGIVVFHSNAARSHRDLLQPNNQRLLICIKAESPPYPGAQLHIVQNPSEADELDRCYYLPHWPQPGLLPRDPDRVNRFENITFLGHAHCLAPELLTTAWTTQLSDLGLRWQPKINHNPWHDHRTIIPHWHDYRQIDAVVAIRSFESHRYQETQYYRHKPATKLYNAWLAGVPAILGPESAYRAERKSPWDYLEVTTLEALLTNLLQLQQDVRLRQRMVAQGWERSLDYHPERITHRWQTFLETVAIPAYEAWCSQAAWRQTLWWVRSHSHSYRVRARNRVHKLIYQ